MSSLQTQRTFEATPPRPQSRLKRLIALSHGPASALVSLALLLLVWELAINAFAIPSYVLPPPTSALRALADGLLVDPTSRASFWYQLSDIVRATVCGFAIGSVAGVTIAAAMAESEAIKRLGFPYIVGFQCLPKVAIAPCSSSGWVTRSNRRSRCRPRWSSSPSCSTRWRVSCPSSESGWSSWPRSIIATAIR